MNELDDSSHKRTATFDKAMDTRHDPLSSMQLELETPQMLPVAKSPEDYPAWRTNAADRAEDAAYMFGYHLILHCRDEAIARMPPDATADTKAAIESAVDIALHNMMDMLEGFWPLRSGSYSLEYVLQVRVRDASGKAVESLDLSPCKLDLPIGYWKWAHERTFK